MTKVVLEFGGGLEALFDNKKKVDVTTPQDVRNVGQLITWVKNNLIRERHDMFTIGDVLRPGVLVLINDVDWELENTTQYGFNDGDHIAFISTLHGG